MTTEPTALVATGVGLAPPVGPMVPTWHRVVASHTETADTVTLAVEPIEAVDGVLAPPAPGQFHMLYVVGVGEVPISVSSVEDGHLGFTVRAVGAVTGALVGLPVGAVLGVRGPYGTAWALERAEGGDVLVVAGGLGLAPLREAVRTLLDRRDRYDTLALVVGARTPRDLLYVEELDAWRRGGGLDVAVTVDVAERGWWGSVGVVTTLLGRAPVVPARTTALVCGPEVMMRATARQLVADGVPAAGVQVSLERNMHCAVAHCGHCQFGPRLVCRDGAVFDYPAVADLLGVREL